MTTEQNKLPPGNTLSETELRDASNLFKIFLQAWKNYSLYPEGFCQFSLKCKHFFWVD